LISYPNQLRGPGIGPVKAAERVPCLDILRGVAVLGILVMNVYAFAMPLAAYGNPLVMGGTDVLDIGTWFFTHLFFDQKFMSIFAMLFGAGLIIMMQRAESRAVAFGPIYYRRTFWLVVLGALHGYFIWFGDILFHYGLMGMLVFLMRKASPKTHLAMACAALPIALLINFASSFHVESLQSEAARIEQAQAAGAVLDAKQRETLGEWQDVRPLFAPDSADIEAEVQAYRGSYIDTLVYRVPLVAFLQFNLTPVFVVWRVGGLMLIGMALMKLGVLSGERDTACYARMAYLGYGIGIPLAVLSAVLLDRHEFDPLYTVRYGGIANYFGSILVAFGHIGAVMVAIRSGAVRGIADRLAAVGRMALSNYLMQSLVMTTIFYGYGLGLYGQVPRFWQQLFVVALIGTQLLVSPWWLRYFHFGPAEWLWRSLTYGQRQPMRR